MVIGGIALLAAGSSNERIPRVAGILILVGAVIFVAALVGAI
jgi:hypothetical protein